MDVIITHAGVDAVVKHMVIPAGPGGVIGNAAGHPEQIGRDVPIAAERIRTRLRLKQLRFIREAGQIALFGVKIVHIDAAVVGGVLTIGGQKADLLHRHHIDGVIGAGLAEGVDAV